MEQELREIIYILEYCFEKPIEHSQVLRLQRLIANGVELPQIVKAYGKTTKNADKPTVNYMLAILENQKN